jgi:hypothetical protein
MDELPINKSKNSIFYSTKEKININYINQVNNN